MKNTLGLGLFSLGLLVAACESDTDAAGGQGPIGGQGPVGGQSSDGGEAANGGNGGGVSDGGGGGAAETVSKSIAADAGGSVSDADGVAELTIPASSLAADTVITLTVVTAAGGAESDIFDFGPDGTTFATPATLAITFAGTVPEGKTPVVAVLEDATWTPLANPAFASGVVSGSVDHFSEFAVVFVDEAEASACDATCMGQTDAICCTQCGGCQQQQVPVCQPQCASPLYWDCEQGCCYDYQQQACDQ